MVGTFDAGLACLVRLVASMNSIGLVLDAAAGGRGTAAAAVDAMLERGQKLEGLRLSVQVAMLV